LDSDVTNKRDEKVGTVLNEALDVPSNTKNDDLISFISHDTRANLSPNFIGTNEQELNIKHEWNN
jgi:hypothetical protein